MSSYSAAGEAWASYGALNFIQAAHLSQAILHREPDNVQALACQAMCHMWLDEETDSALRVIRKLIKHAPKVPKLYDCLGELYSYRGEIEKAVAAYEAALAMDPHNPNHFFNLSGVKKYATFDENCQRMLSFVQNIQMHDEYLVTISSALAKIYSDLGDYEKAMEFCMKANNARNQIHVPLVQQQHLAALRKLKTDGRFASLPDSGVSSDAPLFIVGMPRSGTSLVETILGRHRRVRPCGEMVDVFEIEGRILAALPAVRKQLVPNLALLDHLNGDMLKGEAEALLNKVAAKKGGRYDVYTDKMPPNGTRLGLIAKLFPNARVIYVQRNPVDCCISNLFARFGAAYAYTTRQDWLGAYYRYHEQVIDLWREITDLEVLDVHYDQLVAEPERVTREMVAFAGLKWDPACLDPEGGSNEVRTASVWQARQPINTNSVGRWRRYEPWIQPLIAALGGYEALGEVPGITSK